ncbi:copC domain protein [Mycobacterium xenopi 4042]|uniref:CopC domain protein n=1 Tax=Mycobacterium xenopi 4042 TaxID=1299334 RepID=X8CL36_MYCXE|nr:copC domain protein [Mycobacterium xenopi 4042]
MRPAGRRAGRRHSAATPARVGLMTGVARAATLGLLLAAIIWAGVFNGAPVAAHAIRVSADPPENAVLNTGPARVSATFNEPMQTSFAAMTVVGRIRTCGPRVSRRCRARSSASASDRWDRPAPTR